MGINLADKGYNNVPTIMPGEFTLLPAGGYVCKIFHAELKKSKAGNDMLVLLIDVEEGQFANTFRSAFARLKDSNPSNWDSSGIYRQLVYDHSGNVISPFFKGLLTCIQKSNPNFSLNLSNFNPFDLRGKLCGFIFAQEEYSPKNSTGIVRIRSFAKFPRTVDDIRNGNFTVPDLKKLPVSNSSTPAPDPNDPFAGTPIDPSDTPF